LKTDFGIGGELDFDGSVGVVNAEVFHLLIEGRDDAIGNKVASWGVGV
jgi:hypothetical protein